MKKTIYILLVIQIILIVFGVYQIFYMNPYIGIFNIILNVIFFVVNIYTLKDYYANNK